MRKLIVLALFIIGLSGCSTYNVNVTGFGGLNAYPVKTYDFRLSKEITSDLESMEYVKLLEKQLACAGWQRDTTAPIYTIIPTFSIIMGKLESDSKARVGFGLGTGSFGNNIGLGTFIGTSTGSAIETEFTKLLDLKLLLSTQTEDTPLWQGKIYIQNAEDQLSKVMPVLIKYGVENFGIQTNGQEEFTFDASEKNLKIIEDCTIEN